MIKYKTEDLLHYLDEAIRMLQSGELYEEGSESFPPTPIRKKRSARDSESVSATPTPRKRARRREHYSRPSPPSLITEDEQALLQLENDCRGGEFEEYKELDELQRQIERQCDYRILQNLENSTDSSDLTPSELRGFEDSEDYEEEDYEEECEDAEAESERLISLNKRESKELEKQSELDARQTVEKKEDCLVHQSGLDNQMKLKLLYNQLNFLQSLMNQTKGELEKLNAEENAVEERAMHSGVAELM